MKRLLIFGGAETDAAEPEWEGYRCVCMPRSRATFCDLRDGVWTTRIDPKMLDAFVEEAARYDAVFCETPEALLLVTEWKRRGIAPRPILALEVDGFRPVEAFGKWYRDTHAIDPVPALLATPWVSWIATSEAQATRLEAAGVDRKFLHRIPTGASLFSMLSAEAGELLSTTTPPIKDGEFTEGRVLFPGNGRRDWQMIVDAVLAMPELPFSLIGGIKREVQRRFVARGVHRWPANFRYLESVPLETYIDLVRAAKLAVVPLLPGSGDGGHSTIAIVHRAGVPLVCTDSPALVGYVDGGAARLFAPGDVAGLVAAVREVAGNPTLSRALADEGRRAEARRDVDFRRTFCGAIDRASAALPPA